MLFSCCPDRDCNGYALRLVVTSEDCLSYLLILRVER